MEDNSLTSFRAFFLSFSGAPLSEIYLQPHPYLFEGDFGGIPLPYCKVNRREASPAKNLEHSVVLDPFHRLISFLRYFIENHWVIDKTYPTNYLHPLLQSRRVCFASVSVWFHYLSLFLLWEEVKSRQTSYRIPIPVVPARPERITWCRRCWYVGR